MTKEECLRLVIELGDVPSQASVHGNMGNALEALGRYQEALAAHQKDLRPCNELSDVPCTE